MSEIVLTDSTFRQGLAELKAQDQALGAVLEAWGPPPFWTHPPGFPGLVNAILGQQVSLESAQAAFSRLEDTLGSITPSAFLSLEDAELRAIGFSRQKASYARGIARGKISGEIDLRALESMDDDAARSALVSIRGVGPWTADTYLLFALRRADAWPSGDLALARAIQDLLGLAKAPSYPEVDAIAEKWRPWRAVAARILWHDYLCERGRSG